VETPFEIPFGDGALRGHRTGTGRPALLLHGGAAVPDYMGGCAAALDGLFATIRYTQRGTPPSGGEPPYTIETHVADAIAVLDFCELDRAWAIGHSWGGHLALHLALAAPARLDGLLLIDPLGADPSVFPAVDANLRRRLSDEQVARVDDIERRRREGDVTEADLVERFALVWPQYFTGGKALIPPPERVGVHASIETNRSVAAHFERGTLLRELGALDLPVLFVHGEDDPMPVASSTSTAALFAQARIETIPDCGHFPWVEQPDAFRAAVERLTRAVAQSGTSVPGTGSSGS
jgi:pimeloyl-ACP methyl ester carboxylesterase